jgi:enoyl-CoA hydratase
MNPDILCERDGDIATVTLFNPDKLNALNAFMWRRLRETVAAGGRCFPALRDPARRGRGLRRRRRPRGIQDRARQCRSGAGLPRGGGRGAGRDRVLPASDVAAILGPCVGGGLEIACACDLRIAGEGAKFGAPIMKLGFSMYPGELAGFLKLAGPAVAKEILLEGRLLNAAEAYAKGLLTRVVADDAVEPKRRPRHGASPPVRRWWRAGTSSGSRACWTAGR